jgi:hypothetical protein
VTIRVVRYPDVQACIAAIGPSTAVAVAGAMGWSVDGARSVLERLCRGGELRRTRGGQGRMPPVYYPADGPAPPEPERPEAGPGSPAAAQARRYLREWRRWRAGRGPNPLIPLGVPGRDDEEDPDP